MIRTSPYVRYRAIAAALAAAVFISGGAGIAGAAADGRATCRPYEQLVAGLEKQYGEVPVARGVAGGGLVELLVSAGGETWSIISVSARGQACLFASGEGWRWLDRTEQGPRITTMSGLTPVPRQVTKWRSFPDPTEREPRV